MSVKPSPGTVSLTDTAAVSDKAAEIERRKSEHLTLASGEGVETRASAGWDDVHLAHDALPAVDAADIDLSVELLGRALRSPLVITGMTGGHQAAREVEPTAFIVGNIGISQLLDQPGEHALGHEDVVRVIEMVRADALAVHLNYLEEMVQPEGQTRARGADRALAELARTCGVPVIAKETGAGIGRATALRLADLGVRAIDVGGVGGTSFAAIEARRARDRGDERRGLLGERFTDWGLPTAVAVVGARATGRPIVGTGGVRSGHDAAKALALGATAVGVGRPLLQAALRGEAAVDEWIAQFDLELRTATFLSGAASVRMLHSVPRVISGSTKEWIAQLGY